MDTAPQESIKQPIQPMQQAESERRFAFGKNWSRYLASLDEPYIKEAEASLKNWLKAEPWIDEALAL